MRRTRVLGLGSAVLILVTVAFAYLPQTTASTFSPNGAAPIAADNGSDPTDANGWEKLGTDALQAGNYDKAIQALQKALDMGFPPAIGKYNLACAYARAGNNQKALDLLESLPLRAFSGPIANDPDLAHLASEPRFQKLAKQVQRSVEPCKDAEANPQYRQLDFWVGEWDVFSGKQKVGESSVQLILKDCVVFENWRGMTGDTGKSLNKYNNLTHEWEQFWVSDSGTTNYFKGSLVNGEMRYTLEMPTSSGGTLLRHLTFSKVSEGKVRQLSEASTDGGKTWSTEYDFVYVKKEPGEGST